MTTTDNCNPLTVAIIGSGFSGICAAIQLKEQLGITAHVFEASQDIGGTWHHNTYPGCACDVASHLYSFSFAKNPSWSQRYSPQPEIYEYLRRVANKYHIYEQTKLNTEVVKAEWVDERQQWKLEFRERGSTETHTAYFNLVFAGLGPLRVPHVPEIFKQFEGIKVHTGFWDKNIDFTNKRVAVIGSGSSAIQAIPKLAEIASEVHCFQRTPAWVLARKQYHYSEIVKKLFFWLPWLMTIYRFVLFLRNELKYMLGFGYHNSWTYRVHQRQTIKQMTKRLEAQGRPDLVPKLIPDYPVGCKRITLSEDYLEAVSQSHVTVNRSAITKVEGRTITTADGKETEIDILCLATGFNVQGFLGNLQVFGRNSQSLNKLWDENYPDTFKSVTIHGFPNFFMLLGPAAALGHSSVVSMVECQVNFALDRIKRMQSKNLAAIEPKIEAQNEFVATLKKDLKPTVWNSGCRSWYMNKDGEVFSLWSSTVTKFWWTLRNTDSSDFIEYKRP
ncbi:putative flavin-binding monooxygenase [Radiomyces spectabilis]|uniref:putative flavin-binding monooxygenase n=1 Tax=Radiomyces spectabilis TaxID=64574 RepID=UPI002220B4B3|nr:putative flavin-binding monooxygenase [Radiomyces spectabilis]KAI8381112.1 putative flavin-binding monooxygenase [Radiomyces spectabilis]